MSFDFFEELDEEFSSGPSSLEEVRPDNKQSGGDVNEDVDEESQGNSVAEEGSGVVEEEVTSVSIDLDSSILDEDEEDDYIPGQAGIYAKEDGDDDYYVPGQLSNEELGDLDEDDDLTHYFGYPQSDEDNYIDTWVDDGWTGLLNLDMVLSFAIEEGASDIHITGGQAISFTVLGDIVKQDRFVVPDQDIMESIVFGMLSHQDMSVFLKDLEYDFSYVIRFGPYKGRRFRVNIGRSFGNNLATFRTISDEIPKLEDLGLDSNITDLFDSSTGVVLFAGATGSGKSTSLASIIRNIQLTKPLKIITVEKPIEYVYPTDGKSYIVQRAIPEDCIDFGYGLTSAMRSAPNIILIGEVRNRHEVDELLRAAETGHLSISTIHASNNVTTLNRIRSLFEGEEQKRVLGTLGDTLRGIVNQVLVKTKDGKGRRAYREVLHIDFNIRKLIADDKFEEIRKYQEDNELTMEQILYKAVKAGEVNYEDARDKAPDPTYFEFVAKNDGYVEEKDT